MYVKTAAAGQSDAAASTLNSRFPTPKNRYQASSNAPSQLRTSLLAANREIRPKSLDVVAGSEGCLRDIGRPCGLVSYFGSWESGVG
jgi:hypothetical protein